MVFEFLNPIDFSFSKVIQSFHNEILSILILLFNFLGNPMFWFAIAALFFWRGNHRQSFFIVTIILFAGALTSALKYIIARPRPFMQGFVKIEDFIPSFDLNSKFDTSFPSGHTTLASAYFLYFKIKKFKYLILGGFLVAMVMLSRVYMGMHFLSDVVAGIIIGLIIAKIVEIPVKKIAKNEMKITKINPLFAGFLIFIFLALGIEYFSLPTIAMVFAGFYSGFLTNREIKLDHSIIPIPKLIIRGIIGGSIAIIPLLLNLNPLEQSINYFFSGLWITLIYPLIYTKLLKMI